MCGEFEAKLEIMGGKMGFEVNNVLELFKTFSMIINVVVALVGAHTCVFST